MPSRRPLILLGTLLLLLAYVFRANWFPSTAGVSTDVRIDAAPLAGRNVVSGLRVWQATGEVWKADFDYFYTGEPRTASLRIELIQPGGSGNPGVLQGVPMLQRGAHHVSVAITYPGSEQRTTQVLAVIRNPTAHDVPIASQLTDQVIDWPDWKTWARNQDLATNTPEQNLARAVALIDSEGAPQLSEAKSILEGLIGQNPRFDAGYVELARIAMKSNWGPEGLHQAENLLASALQIRPDSANAKILLGYVYVHQNRAAKAESLLADAANSKTTNLWLWANWGEALLMQGKFDQAAVKYREAIARPMTHDTYDRARAEAYRQLLTLLERRKDLDGMEALYKQRVAEFGPGSCYSADYARFMLQQRGDTQGAIDLARRALNQKCDDSPSRQILGLAEYVKWASTTGPQRTESLNQARIYLPLGPMPLYLLAGSDRTVAAARQLLAAGEQIDQRDNDKLTALAYALQNGDLAAAKRLLALGARADTPVGYGAVPVALMPVMEVNIEAIRIMQQSGVDYSKLRYHGATAFDFAKQSGNTALLGVLGRKADEL